MKILYLCGDHGIPAFGRKGASTHMREMIAAFRALGHQVMLAASDLSGDRRPEEDFPQVALPRPRSRLLGFDGRYLLASWKAKSVLEKAVADFKPDAIYERSALYFTAGEWIAKRHRLPRILEVNALLSHEQETRLRFPRLAVQREIALVRNATAIATISITMARELAKYGCDRDKMRPFSMAVDLARFQPPPLPIKERLNLGWGDDTTVVGYVGSMNSYHRPAWFMDLAEKLLQRDGRSPLRFLVVGGGEVKLQRFRSRLQRFVDAGLVHFTGTVPQEDMPRWLCAMDVVLVPGASPQSTPTKMFEAAALGRPMILPATEPISAICGNDSPFLFEPNDFNGMESRVQEFCRTPAIFHNGAAKLRQKVVRDHTWESHAKRLADWFKEMGTKGKAEG